MVNGTKGEGQGHAAENSAALQQADHTEGELGLTESPQRNQAVLPEALRRPAPNMAAKMKPVVSPCRPRGACAERAAAKGRAAGSQLGAVCPALRAERPLEPNQPELHAPGGQCHSLVSQEYT